MGEPAETHVFGRENFTKAGLMDVDPEPPTKWAKTHEPILNTPNSTAQDLELWEIFLGSNSHILKVVNALSEGQVPDDFQWGVYVYFMITQLRTHIQESGNRFSRPLVAKPRDLDYYASLSQEMRKTLRSLFVNRDWSTLLNQHILDMTNDSGLWPYQLSPHRLEDNDMEKVVARSLNDMSPKLKGLTSSSYEFKYWRGAGCANTQTKAFYDKIKIPIHKKRPSFLLHKLGHVESTMPHIYEQVDELFNGRSRSFVNGSGLGKTRTTLEGLTRRFGFYFVLAGTSHGNTTGLGSYDMVAAMRQTIFDQRYTRSPVEPEQVIVNEGIAQRQMRKVIASRLFIFDRYLGGISLPYSDACLSWVKIQVLFTEVFGTDIFFDLFQALDKASDAFLIRSIKTSLLSIQSLLQKLHYEEPLYVVLDEAEAAAREHPGSFRTKPGDEERSILQPIVHALNRHLEQWVIIVTGTDISSIDSLKDTVSTSTKPDRELPTTYHDIDVFNKDSAMEYCLQYFPPHLRKHSVIRRLGFWMQGRHQLAANIMMFFMLNDFQSLHRVLTAYIKAFCYLSFSPNDAKTSEAVEPDLSNRILNLIQDHTQGVQLPDLRTRYPVLYQDVVHDAEEYMVYESLPQPKLVQDSVLIEHGIGRLVRFNDTLKIIIDEPLIFCSIMGYCYRHDIDYPKHRVICKAAMTDNIGRSNPSEMFAVTALSQAFERAERIGEVLDFPVYNKPDWADEEGRVVQLIRNDEGHWETIPVSKLESPRPGEGKTAHSAQEVVDWLNKSTSEDRDTAFCYPVQYMGPDCIFLLELSSGRYVWVFLQVKLCASAGILPIADLKDAARSVIPESAWKIKSGLRLFSSTQTSSKAQFFSALDDLNNKVQTVKGNPQAHHVLGVLSVYPRQARLERLKNTAFYDASLATVNWDAVTKLVDQEGTRMCQVMLDDMKARGLLAVKRVQKQLTNDSESFRIITDKMELKEVSKNDRLLNAQLQEHREHEERLWAKNARGQLDRSQNYEVLSLVPDQAYFRGLGRMATQRSAKIEALRAAIGRLVSRAAMGKGLYDT